MSGLEILQQPLSEIDLNDGKAELDFRSLKVGQGSTVFVTDKLGSRWGNQVLADAPAYIKPDGTFRLKSSTGVTLIDSEDVNGNFMNVINEALNTSTQEILKDFTFEATDHAGALKTGNVTWNASTGAPTGGTGILINDAGLVAVNAGTPTITLDTATGDATFAGTLSAPSGTLGTITAGTIQGNTITGGTITGTTVSSSSGNDKIVLTSGDSLDFYKGGVKKGDLKADASGDIYINAVDDTVLGAGGTQRCQAASGYFGPISSGYNSGRSGTPWNHVYADEITIGDVRCNGGDIYPTSSAGNYCGTSSDPWGEVYTNGCTGCAYKELNLLTEEQKKRQVKNDDLEEYEIGQVLCMFQDDDELKPCNKFACGCVIGVGSDNGVPIVLGAEPVWVTGKVKKGDRLVTSMALGRAKAIKKGIQVTSGAIFARALEDKETEGNGVIKAYINITN